MWLRTPVGPRVGPRRRRHAETPRRVAGRRAGRGKRDPHNWGYGFEGSSTRDRVKIGLAARARRRLGGRPAMALDSPQPSGLRLCPLRTLAIRHIRHIRHRKTSGKPYPSSGLPKNLKYDKLPSMHNLAIYAGLCMAAGWGSSPAAPAIRFTFLPTLPCEWAAEALQRTLFLGCTWRIQMVARLRPRCGEAPKAIGPTLTCVSTTGPLKFGRLYKRVGWGEGLSVAAQSEP